jgi:hypothetical protein
MARIKVHADRRQGLCWHCRSAQITEHVDGHIEVFCQERYTTGGGSAFIRVPVLRCTDYDEKSHASRHDMEKIAWRLNTDKSGKILGFRPPTEKEQE